MSSSAPSVTSCSASGSCCESWSASGRGACGAGRVRLDTPRINNLPRGGPARPEEAPWTSAANKDGGDCTTELKEPCTELRTSAAPLILPTAEASFMLTGEGFGAGLLHAELADADATEDAGVVEPPSSSSA